MSWMSHGRMWALDHREAREEQRAHPPRASPRHSRRSPANPLPPTRDSEPARPHAGLDASPAPRPAIRAHRAVTGLRVHVLPVNPCAAGHVGGTRDRARRLRRGAAGDAGVVPAAARRRRRSKPRAPQLLFHSFWIIPEASRVPYLSSRSKPTPRFVPRRRIREAWLIEIGALRIG